MSTISEWHRKYYSDRLATISQHTNMAYLSALFVSGAHFWLQRQKWPFRRCRWRMENVSQQHARSPLLRKPFATKQNISSTDTVAQWKQKIPWTVFDSVWMNKLCVCFALCDCWLIIIFDCILFVNSLFSISNAGTINATRTIGEALMEFRVSHGEHTRLPPIGYIIHFRCRLSVVRLDYMRVPMWNEDIQYNTIRLSMMIACALHTHFLILLLMRRFCFGLINSSSDNARSMFCYSSAYVIQFGWMKHSIAYHNFGWEVLMGAKYWDIYYNNFWCFVFL